MNFKKFRSLALVLVVLLVGSLVLSGCGNSSTPNTTAAAKDPIVLGVAMATTGNNALGDKYGVNGVQMAVNEVNKNGGINGRELKIVTEDVGDATNVAINAFNKLASEKPAAIMATNVSPMILAVSPIVKQLGVPTFTGGVAVAVTAQDNPWLFRVRPSNAVAAKAAALYAIQDLKAKKIGILYVNGDFGQDGLKVITATLKENGLEPAAVEAHDPQAKDYSPQLLNLQKAGCDAMIFWTNPVNHGQILKQRKILNIKTPYIGSPAASLPSTLALVTPEESDGIFPVAEAMMTGRDDPKVQKYVDDYAAQFKEQTDSTGPAYYDAVMMLADVMKKVGTDPAKVREELLKINGYQGIVHNYAFASNGDGAWDVVITKVQAGKLTKVKDFNVK
jgi:branched-chain amino acid transport system substrate-binding protein